MFESEKFGKKIKELRKMRQLTQEQLSESLGVTVSAISKWETGFTTPELGMVVRLANLFDTSIDVLLDYQIDSMNIDEWINRIDKLTKERKYNQVEEAVEKMLTKYPNNFLVVYKSAIAYRLAGFEADTRYDVKALKLFNRSLELFGQNTDSTITEEEIKSYIATSLNNLERYDEAVKQLEDINQNRQYSAVIGNILVNKQDVTKEEITKASNYLYDSFFDIFQHLVDTFVGLIMVHLDDSTQEYEKALDLSQVILSFLDTMIFDGPVNYLYKLKVTFMTVKAVAYYKLKQFENLEKLLTQTKELAMEFDANPNYSLDNKLLFHTSDDHRVFDSVGETAVESVSYIIQSSKISQKECDELDNVWHGILGVEASHETD